MVDKDGGTKWPTKMAARNGRQRWRYEMADKDGGTKWLTKMAAQNGRQRWRHEMADKDGRSKWPTKMASRNGRQRWPLKMANKDGGTKWLIFDLINFFDLSWSVKAKFFLKTTLSPRSFHQNAHCNCYFKKTLSSS